MRSTWAEMALLSYCLVTRHSSTSLKAPSSSSSSSCTIMLTLYPSEFQALWMPISSPVSLHRGLPEVPWRPQQLWTNSPISSTNFVSFSSAQRLRSMKPYVVQKVSTKFSGSKRRPNWTHLIGMKSLNLRCCGVSSETYLIFSPERQRISPKPTSSSSKRSFLPTLTIPYSPCPLAKHRIWKGFSVSSSMKTCAHERRVFELMMTAFPLVSPITQTQFGKTLLMKKSSVFSFHSNFPSLYISITLFAGFFCSLCDRWAKCAPPKCILDLFRNRMKFLGLLLRTVLRSWVTSRRSCTQSCLEYCTILRISLKWILCVCSASLMSCS